MIQQAINLTTLGMSFVFVFLTILVFATRIMSAFSKFVNKPKIIQDKDEAFDEALDEIDEETRYIIEQAINMHRGA